MSVENISDLNTTLEGGVMQPFRQHRGNVFYVDSASSPITVSFDEKSPVTLSQGQKIAIGYSGFTMRSASTQAVRIKHGIGHISNSSQQVDVTTSATVEGANVTKPGAEITVTAGNTVQLIGANANRKSLRLAIPSTDEGEVYLTDSLNTAKGGILEAGVIEYQDNTASVFAHNYGVSDIRVSVLEMERV